MVIYKEKDRIALRRKYLMREDAGRNSSGVLFIYGFSLFKTSTHRVGVLNYNPPALRVVAIVIRKNHLSAL